jgi:hypothetical protein
VLRSDVEEVGDWLRTTDAELETVGGMWTGVVLIGVSAGDVLDRHRECESVGESVRGGVMASGEAVAVVWPSENGGEGGSEIARKVATAAAWCGKNSESRRTVSILRCGASVTESWMRSGPEDVGRRLAALF